MSDASFVQTVIDLTNQFRAKNGLGTLSMDGDLTEAAQAHTEDMALNDYFSHYGKNGSKPWDRAQAAGYETGIVGENIGMGYFTPKAIVDAWIASPSHRDAMLNPRYNEIGVGYFYLKNDTGKTNYYAYWTQLFGQGEIEGPPVVLPDNFDPLQYGASHADLLQFYGVNVAGLTQHYLDSGAAEGRSLDQFDEVGYLASHDDLLRGFGTDVNAATQHYIQHGYFEGRATTLFQPLQYLASYDDLINALGSNLAAATQHFIRHGFGEGRSRDRFDEARYLASNADLIQHFGYALDAATQHYVQYGMAEKRSTQAFDPAAYLSQNYDLQVAFGSNLAAATRHYIEFGFAEGR
ncbi:MAG TPA: CAP domain-containing protein [Candidatus Obscuribacterales bacterium]